MKNRTISARLMKLLLGLGLGLSACAPADPPGASPDDIATIVVATQRAAPSNTPAPTVRPSSTPAPTLTSTAVPGTPVAPSRVDLSDGATSARIDAVLAAGETKYYVIRGAQAQPMLVSLFSDAGDATLIMMSQGGTYFVRPGEATAWRGSLPQAGDYFLGVYGGASSTPFTLTMQLAKRITFKEGEDAVAFAGNTPHGSIVTYSVFGIKGTKMTVAVSHTAGRASLGVSGFLDHVDYLGVEEDETFLELVLPATQDYIIEIVPQPGRDVDYILDLKLE